MGEHGEIHLPHGSIWPIILAGAIAILGLGVVFDPLVAALGFAAVAAALVGWIGEDVRWYRGNIGTGPGIAKFGTQLFISSEVFLFGGLFATYFTLRAQAGHWPDSHVELPIVKTAVFSVFLLSSSFTVHKAEAALKAGNKKGFEGWWLGTIILGAIFLGGQVNEYLTLIEEGAVLGSGHFVSTFYMLTGTHGLHVFGGLLYLVIVLMRSRLGQFDAERHVAPQTAAMYWHFVDLVWVIVFTVLYVIQ